MCLRCTQIYNFVKETMFRYLSLNDVRKTIEKTMKDTDMDDEAKKTADLSFIQSCVISLTLQKSHCKFANRRAVEALFDKAKLNAILKSEELGGQESWSVDDIMMIADDDDKLVPIWSLLSMTDINQHIHDWLRNIKAYADGIPEDQYYRYVYTGNRKLVAKNANELALTATKGEKRRRGMSDLDETGQGLKESFQRNVELLRKQPWATLAPEAVIKQILSPSEGQAGEQGGHLLASYLVLKRDDFLPIQTFGGVVPFLEANLAHYKKGDVAGTTSTATQLVMHAISFATELIPLLAAAAEGMHNRGPIFQRADAERQPIFDVDDEDQVRPSAAPARELSASFTSALPPRRAGQSSTPASRTATRERAMRLMQNSGSAVGLAQANAEASTVHLLDVRSDKTRGSRGRIMGAGHLRAGLRQVTAQLRTSKLRTDFHSNSCVIVDDEAEGSDDDDGHAQGMGVRAGRRFATGDVPLPVGQSWRRDPPASIKPGQLVATVHMGPRGQLAWYDAIVVQVQKRNYNHGQKEVLRLYFTEDGHDDWYTLPDGSIAFHHGHKATHAELKAAKAATAHA